MLRIFAKWYARLSYLWQLEVEGAKGEINAATATRNAAEKRKLVEKLNAEADGMEKRIAEVSAMEEKGYWTCESGHENEKGKQQPGANAPLPVCIECGKPATFMKRELMSGQEKYESDKERKEAERMIAEKRNLAKQESENVSSAEQAAQMLRGQAANARAFAEKIRSL